jgi:hypothetical protein
VHCALRAPGRIDFFALTVHRASRQCICPSVTVTAPSHAWGLLGAAISAPMRVCLFPFSTFVRSRLQISSYSSSCCFRHFAFGCVFDVPICCTPLSACGPIFSSLATWGPKSRAALGLASLAARRVLPCHGRFRHFASRLPAVLSSLAGVRQHPVEVATEAEPLSLSIARARILLSRLSVFSSLPCLVRACSPKLGR